MSSLLNGTIETPSNLVPSYLLTASDMIVSYAKGHMTYEELGEKLDAWWENNKEVWQEDDLSQLFRLICRTS